MTIDHYSPCPCGSGKKLKFCKCVEQPQDLERIIKLIDGGQELAAIDRINQMLAKTPNAAWLLAIKGELSLGMQEVGTFKETANRFLKLKPDNPLALIMKSIVASIDNEPVENAARYLLQGMSESRESLPALTLAAIRILIRSLAAVGKLSLVGYWSDILNALSGDEGPDNDSALLDPGLNLLAKSPSRVMPDPPGAAWKERLAEVLTLVRTFRYAQAESKLRLILRDFPDQPGPLSHLLRSQSAQLDQSAAFATARKLAQHLELSAEDRAYFAAIALELEPQQKSLQSELLVRYCQIDSEERVAEGLAALDFVETVEGEGLEQVKSYYAAMVQDEVPAKRLFTAFSGGLKATSDSDRRIVSSVATVVLFGKQTDKPARALLMANSLPKYSELISQIEETVQFGEEIPDVEVPAASSYTEFLHRPKTIVGDAHAELSLEEGGQVLIEDFLDVPVRLLGGVSPREAASDEKKRGDLISLLYHFEGEQSFIVPRQSIDEVYRRLDLERPQVQFAAGNDSLRLFNILDLDRVDPTALNDGQLKGLMVRAMGFGASRVFYHSAKEVKSRASLAGEVQVRVAAMSGLLSLEPELDAKLACCRELEQALVAAEAPVGKVIIQQVSLLHSAGRAEEAQQVLINAAKKYPADPYLMSFLQYAMQSQGGAPGGPGGQDDLAMKMLKNARGPAPAAAPQAQSGLVLPGQESGGSPDGGSKLWLPGS